MQSGLINKVATTPADLPDTHRLRHVCPTQGAIDGDKGFPGTASLDFEIAGMGDVDGNGTADLVWRNFGTDEIIVWLMNGAKIASSGIVGVLDFDLTIEQVTDTNGDGKADLIIRDRSFEGGEVIVWLLNGATIIGSGSPGTVSLDWEIQN